MALCLYLLALRINPAETPLFPKWCRMEQLTVQIYGGSGPQAVFPVPVSVETDPALNRASWVKPPYAPLTEVPPVTKISIAAGQLSRNGTEVNVPLTITNTGSVAASLIEISQITLRTLAGSGQATLAGPVLPLQIGRLSPGASSTIMLRLNVPSTVKKLALIENGAVQSTANAAYRFSLGQVIFP